MNPALFSAVGTDLPTGFSEFPWRGLMIHEASPSARQGYSPGVAYPGGLPARHASHSSRYFVTAASQAAYTPAPYSAGNPRHAIRASRITKRYA